MRRIQPLRRPERLNCSLILWLIPMLALGAITMVGMIDKFGYDNGIRFTLNIEQFKLPPLSQNEMAKIEYIANMPFLIRKTKDTEEDKMMEIKNRYEITCNPSWNLERAFKTQDFNESTLHPNITNSQPIPTVVEFETDENMSLAKWLKTEIHLLYLEGTKIFRPRFDTDGIGKKHMPVLPYINNDGVGKHFIENYYNTAGYEDVVFDFDRVEFNVFNGYIKFSDNGFKDFTTMRHETLRKCVLQGAHHVRSMIDRRFELSEHMYEPNNDEETKYTKTLLEKNIEFLAKHKIFAKPYIGVKDRPMEWQAGYKPFGNQYAKYTWDMQEHLFVWRWDTGGLEDLRDARKTHHTGWMPVILMHPMYGNHWTRFNTEMHMLPGRDVTTDILQAENIRDFFICSIIEEVPKVGKIDNCKDKDVHDEKDCTCMLVPNLYTDLVKGYDEFSKEAADWTGMHPNKFAFWEAKTEGLASHRRLYRNRDQEGHTYRDMVKFFNFYLIQNNWHFWSTILCVFLPMPKFLQRLRLMEFHRWWIRFYLFLCFVENFTFQFLFATNPYQKIYCNSRRRNHYPFYPLTDRHPDVPGTQLIDIPSLPGVECEYAPGQELITLRRRMHNFVGFSLFFWMNGGQARRIWQAAYNRVRVPWPANFRAVRPNNWIVMFLFPYIVYNLVRYDWIIGTQEMMNAKTKLLYQEEANCDLRYKEQCMLQGVQTKEHIRKINDFSYTGANDPTIDFSEFQRDLFIRETLFPHDLSDPRYGIPNAASYDMMFDDFVQIETGSKHENLEQEKYFTTNRKRQYSTFALLFFLFFVSSFGENGLLTNKLHKLHKHQWRRGILCAVCLMMTSLMKTSMFYDNWFMVADKKSNILGYVALIVFKVFCKFAPLSYMVHVYCNTLASLTTTHGLHKLINQLSMLFRGVWFTLGPAVLLCELKNTFKFQGWYYQAKKHTIASDAMKAFYDTGSETGKFNTDKVYGAGHFYLPDQNEFKDESNSQAWPSIFLTDQFSTIAYSIAQTITNTSFGDIVPTSVTEIVIACFILLFGWFILFNKVVNMFFNQLQSTMKMSELGVGNEGKDYENQVYDHNELDILPTGVKKECDYFLMETLCCQNRSKIFSKLRLPELKLMGEGLRFHTLYANDTMDGGDGFVMFIKSGQWELHLLDCDVSIELNYSDHQVFFEQGCIHNKMDTYQIRCTSEFGEIYTISREHIMNVCESQNIRFGHGRSKCEVHGVVGNFEPIYETKHERKERKMLQKAARKARDDKLRAEFEREEREKEEKERIFKEKKKAMKEERARLKAEKEAAEAAAKAAAGEAAEKPADTDDGDKKEKKKKKKDKKDKKDKKEGKAEDTEGGGGAETGNEESGEKSKKKKKKKDKKSDKEGGSAAAAAEEEKPKEVEAKPETETEAAETAADTDAEGKPKKSKKSKKEKKEKKDKKDGDKKDKKKKKPLLGGQGAAGKLATKTKDKVQRTFKTVAHGLIEFYPGSIELFYWKMFIMVHAIVAFIYYCNRYSFFNTQTDYGHYDSVAFRQNNVVISGQYYQKFVVFFIYPAFICDFLVNLYTGQRDRDNNIVFNPIRQWKRISWSDLIIKRMVTLIHWIRYCPIPKWQNIIRWTYFWWDPTDPHREWNSWYVTQEQVVQGEATINWNRRLNHHEYEQFNLTWEFIHIGYYYYLVMEIVNSQFPRRVGYLKTKIIETTIQICMLAQFVSALLYGSTCSIFRDNRERFGLQGSCTAGSWGWLYFNENEFESAELTFFARGSRWFSTLYVVWKIISGYGSAGVNPAYWWTRGLLAGAMIMGVVMLAKVIALIKFASNSLKTVEFQSNWISIENAMSSISKSNSKLYNAIYNSKLKAFTNNLVLNFNNAEKFKLTEIDLFNDIPKIALERCTEMKKLEKFQAGSVILEQDQEGKKFYLLKKGTIKASKNGENTGFLRVGDMFNIYEMFAEQSSKSEFKAFTDCEVWSWSEQDLKKGLDTVWTPFTMKLKSLCEDRLEKAESNDNEVTCQPGEKFSDFISKEHCSNVIKYFIYMISLIVGSTVVGLISAKLGSDKVTITVNGVDQEIAQNSWLHQLFKNQISNGEAVTFGQYWASILFYWVNCVTNNGVFGTKLNGFEYVFEFLVHLGGIVLSLFMFSELSKMADLTDKIHKYSAETLAKLKHRFKASEGGSSDIVNNKIKENLTENYNKRVDAQIFKWLPFELRSEMAAELYTEVLSATYFKADEAKIMASHVETRRTVEGVFLYEDQLVDYAYFIAEGEFVCSDNNDVLGRGSAIVFDQKSYVQIRSSGRGLIYRIPIDVIKQQASNEYNQVNYGVIKNSNKNTTIQISDKNEKQKEEATKQVQSSFASQHVVYYALISWMLAFINYSRFKLSPEFSDCLVRIDVLFGFFVFGVVMKYLNDKNLTPSSVFKSSSSDKWLFLASIPLCYSPLTAFSRALVILTFKDTASLLNVGKCVNSQKFNFINIFFSGLLICVLCTGLQLFSVNDQASIQGMFDMNGEINSTTTTTKPNDIVICLQYFYSSIDSFTSTGNNGQANLQPTSAIHIILHIILCVTGRIYFLYFIAFGKNITESRLENIHTEYTKIHTRIVNYIKKTGCHETRLGERKTSYLLNTLECIYHKTKFLEDKTITDDLMPGLKKKFCEVEYSQIIRDRSEIFKGVSDVCIAEIAARIMKTENYLAGNIIQEVNCQFEGFIVVLEGSIFVDNTQMFIKGDCLFDDYVRNFEIRAFSNSKIGLITNDDLCELLEFYDKDEQIIMRNLASAVEIMKEEAILNPIRNLLDEEDRKKKQKQKQKELDSHTGVRMVADKALVAFDYLYNKT